MSNDNALIAQIGRTIGLWGDLKFHLHTDFAEQFKIGTTYHTERGKLTVSDMNIKRGTIRFVGYESIDSAKKLTNTKIYANEEQTREQCDLNEGQYFWFDIIGCDVDDAGVSMGKIEDIQRMGDTDYLVIATDATLASTGLSKTFLLPYIDRYIVKADIDNKIVYTKDAKDILEAS
ncbi:MAG: 16S rRNA processing protein RimM [uncultured Sulfurovum sp.]|uniref:Ribosome maturation factor RimM n=1 Tax=uncultured Sulfurovum sp. TaxID=269237 RepID=A0A6S6STE0_9BACT|nr:MAG: 16S rRNA processing protein RimM [uncultured Sulfurovum sp.]